MNGMFGMILEDDETRALRVRYDTNSNSHVKQYQKLNNNMLISG